MAEQHSIGARQMPLTIRVAGLLGRYCITGEDGDSLRSAIIVLWQLAATSGRSPRITLDFTGVALFSAPFFHAALGEFTADATPEELIARLDLVGLDELYLSVAHRVMANAREYHTNPAVRAYIDGRGAAE